MNFKKIIAREGLVILFLLTLAIILINLTQTLSDNSTKHVVDFCNSKNIVLNFSYDENNWRGNIKGKESVDISKYTDEELQNLLKAMGLRKKADIFSVIASYSLLSLLCYPLYLLFRFILWAIRTLKQKG